MRERLERHLPPRARLSHRGRRTRDSFPIPTHTSFMRGRLMRDPPPTTTPPSSFVLLRVVIPPPPPPSRTLRGAPPCPRAATLGRRPRATASFLLQGTPHPPTPTARFPPPGPLPLPHTHNQRSKKIPPPPNQNTQHPFSLVSLPTPHAPGFVFCAPPSLFNPCLNPKTESTNARPLLLPPLPDPLRPLT